MYPSQTYLLVARQGTRDISYRCRCHIYHRFELVCIPICSGEPPNILFPKFTRRTIQPLYVKLATNIFTGMHGACLLLVTFWFIYQLKHDSAWVKRLRVTITWITEPYTKLCRKYNQDLQLQRNIFW